MSVIKVLQYPDPRLRKKGEIVASVDDEIRQIVKTMFDTHYAQENCAALAATQLDFATPKAITVIDYSAKKDSPLCLINPKIIASEGSQIEEEACMSVWPGHIHEKVERAYKVTVQALNEEGEEITFDAQGYFAKCLQHEIDHLHGKLFIDHLSPLKRNRVEKIIQKVRRAYLKKKR